MFFFRFLLTFLTVIFLNACAKKSSSNSEAIALLVTLSFPVNSCTYATGNAVTCLQAKGMDANTCKNFNGTLKDGYCETNGAVGKCSVPSYAGFISDVTFVYYPSFTQATAREACLSLKDGAFTAL